MNSLVRNDIGTVILGLHVWIVLALGVALARCATPRRTPIAPSLSVTGDTSWRMVAPGTERYSLAIGDVSSGAAPLQRVAPVYPSRLLAACPAPVEVKALLIVDQAGKVGEVRVADEVTAAPDRRQFVDAVRVAALQWQFEPLQITHWAATLTATPMWSTPKPSHSAWPTCFTLSAVLARPAFGPMPRGPDVEVDEWMTAVSVGSYVLEFRASSQRRKPHLCPHPLCAEERWGRALGLLVLPNRGAIDLVMMRVAPALRAASGSAAHSSAEAESRSAGLVFFATEVSQGRHP